MGVADLVKKFENITKETSEEVASSPNGLDSFQMNVEKEEDSGSMEVLVKEKSKEDKPNGDMSVEESFVEDEITHKKGVVLETTPTEEIQEQEEEKEEIGDDPNQEEHEHKQVDTVEKSTDKEKSEQNQVKEVNQNPEDKKEEKNNKNIIDCGNDDTTTATNDITVGENDMNSNSIVDNLEVVEDSELRHL